MGKFIKTKSKTATEVSLMEVPSLGGVLTRAKKLALQKAGSYIQLRSRRLVKPNSVKKQKNGGKLLRSRNLSTVNGNVDSVNCMKSGNKNDEEGSFGENCLEIQEKERTTRETTPCSLIRNLDALKTPGSSTKRTRSSDNRQRVQNTSSRHIPSTSEMDEFFTGPEKQQQKLFIEKYNFDPVNDKPLDGRYEWEKLDSTKKS